jgi:hypothetical protein
MNDQHTIVINVNVLNPAQYLACCGIFAISALFDESSMSYWRLQPQPHFIMESQIDESAMQACLTTVCTDLGRWMFWPPDAQVIQADLHISLLGKKRVMTLDWWYETLTKDGDIAEKSAWKMYSGRLNPQILLQGMITASKEMMQKSQPDSLTQLLALKQGMTSRFGFDCRSSRKALDAGFSANDLPNYKAATYPFLELLAVIGAHSFFPARTKPAHGNESTRGWTEEKVFQYALWMNALPIPLARVAAARAVFEDTATIIPMKSFRSSTGQEGKEQYGYLTLAGRTTLPQGA